jgi:hypothetical protein
MDCPAQSESILSPGPSLGCRRKCPLPLPHGVRLGLPKRPPQKAAATSTDSGVHPAFPSRLSRMKLCLQRLILVLVAAVALSSALVANSSSQAIAKPDWPPVEVILDNLSQPAYPPLARRIWVTGQVNILSGIRQDGSVESAAIVSGPPLLQQSALESAQHSHYQCRGCTEEVTSFTFMFTFQLVPKHCPSPTTLPSDAPEHQKTIHAQVDQPQNHVTIVGEGGICEGVFAWKVRSAKCLYLWKCGWHSS